MANPSATTTKNTLASVDRRYVLGLLLLVYTSNFLDRQILTILLESIKQDLHLSDTQLGFLSGIAFAIFYTTLGIPLARWADKHNRVKLISACIALWSIMTAACGVAANFVQLAIARIGVGVGEAGCSPPAHSIISDYFAREQRASAMSIYSLGIPLGSMLGLLIGGWINELYGWRMAFLCAGLPGVLLAVLVRFTIAEPKRGAVDNTTSAAVAQLSLRQVFATLWQSRAFRYLSLATAALAMMSFGGATWLPAFLMRSHGMSSGQVGTALALISGLGGLAGTLLGGFLADRYGNRDVRWYAWLPGIALLIGFPFSVLAMLTSSPALVLALIVIPSIVPAIHAGPVFSTVQTLAPLPMRSMATAVLLFVVNLIGMGLGPQLVGIISDLLSASYGQESLRYTLLFSSSVAIVAAALYFMAGKHLASELGENHR